MISRAIFVVLIAALLVSSAVDAGNVYYVKKSGNDGSNGSTWASAWATLEKVNSMMQPGDTVRFGSGVWYNSQIRPPAGGNASNVTVYTCSTFSESSRGLTKIFGGELLSGWSVYSGSIYRISYSGPKSYVLGQDDQLLIPAISVGDVNAPSRFFHDAGSGYVYAWLYGNANPDNNTMVIACKEVVRLHLENTDYVKIWGLTLAYGSPQVVGFDAKCQHTSLEHCDIFAGGYEAGSNGGAIFFDANGAGQHSYDSSTYGRYNKILACTIGNLMEERGSAYSHVMTTYSEHHVQVESCYIYPPIGNGIYFKDKLDANTHIGNVARFNVIHGAGQSAILWTSNAYMDSVYGNTIYDCYNGIVNWGSTTLPYEGHLFICNNTIYDITCKGIMITENDSEECGDNNIIKYNIVAGTDLSSCGEDHEIIGFEYSDPSCEDAYTIDSNMYYDCTENFRCHNNSERLFSVWQTSCGFDMHGYYGTNPGFTDPASGDFSRPGAPTQMNRADYGDRQWTLWGAWQPTGDCPTPGTPSLSSPANGASGLSQPVNLDWYDVSGATLYQVQVDNNSNFGSPEISAQPTSSGYSASGLISGTTYYWRARAYNSCGWGNWSVTRSFSLEEDGCPPPPPPTLATPADGASELSQPVNLDWYDVSGALLYQLQVDDNANFGSPEIDAQPSSSSYSASGLDGGTTYFWRVKTYDACEWGGWSVTRSFTTEGDCDPPPPPSYQSPPNGMSNMSQPIPLNWSDVGGVSKYQVHVDDNSGFMNPEIDAEPTESQYSANGLRPLTYYYWRIRSYNACGWGNWTLTRYFVTDPYGSDDHTPPVISNVYADDTTSSTATVHWTTNELATSRVFYVEGLSSGDTTDIDLNYVYSHEVLLEGLYPDTYYEYRVVSRDAAGNEAISGYYVFKTGGMGLDADGDSNVSTFEIVARPHPYPNPFDATVTPHVTFTGIPPGSSLIITTVNGEIVRSWSNVVEDDIIWDGSNDHGSAVSPGVYLWYIESTDFRGKLTVIR